MLATVSVANALSSGIDVLGTYLLMSQTPRASIVQNDGWATYWRRRDT